MNIHDLMEFLEDHAEEVAMLDSDEEYLAVGGTILAEPHEAGISYAWNDGLYFRYIDTANGVLCTFDTWAELIDGLGE